MEETKKPRILQGRKWLGVTIRSLQSLKILDCHFNTEQSNSCNIRTVKHFYIDMNCVDVARLAQMNPLSLFRTLGQIDSRTVDVFYWDLVRTWTTNIEYGDSTKKSSPHRFEGSVRMPAKDRRPILLTNCAKLDVKRGKSLQCERHQFPINWSRQELIRMLA